MLAIKLVCSKKVNTMTIEEFANSIGIYDSVDYLEPSRLVIANSWNISHTLTYIGPAQEATIGKVIGFTSCETIEVLMWNPTASQYQTNYLPLSAKVEVELKQI